MEFKDITVGKKVYFSKLKCSENERKRRYEDSTVYILGKDDAKKTVLASINKFPAQWYNSGQYRGWSSEPKKVIR